MKKGAPTFPVLAGGVREGLVSEGTSTPATLARIGKTIHTHTHAHARTHTHAHTRMRVCTDANTAVHSYRIVKS